MSFPLFVYVCFRYLELESSGRRDEVRFHYTHDQQARVETFPYRLADGRWHRVAFTFSGSRVTLSVNCSQIYSRVIRESVDKTFSADKQQLKLFIGQRNDQHALFRVSRKHTVSDANKFGSPVLRCDSSPPSY